MAQSKSQRNSKARQRYYQREYERLISQGKKLYNSMNLGAVFGVETPSFEDILNYAGTKSGLKRPTKASLKALRRVSSEKGILWGVEKTLGKKASKEAKANITMMRREEDIHRSAVGEASHKLRKEIKRVSQTGNLLSKDEMKQFVNDTMGPIKAMLQDLRYYRNYCKDQLRQMDKYHLSQRGLDRAARMDRAFDTTLECIDKIEDILVNGDTDKIGALSNSLDNFLSMEGGLRIEELYDGGPRLKPAIFNAMVEAVQGPSEEEAAEEQTPAADPTDNWTMNDFEDFPDLF